MYSIISSSSSKVLQPIAGLDRPNIAPPFTSVFRFPPPSIHSHCFQVMFHTVHPSHRSSNFPFSINFGKSYLTAWI
ncbi:hypothetical protein C0J52_13979 [Blattella germanica]|nr:hypothetical protein C0J52_13979 [Blattella germanica]